MAGPPGAISIYVFVLLVLPIIVEGLPNSLAHPIERLLPVSVGPAMINNPVPGALAPWTGFLILCGYTTAILALGTPSWPDATRSTLMVGVTDSAAC